MNDKAIRRLAMAHANVTTNVACKGTALEATTFEVGGKAFLFSRSVTGGRELRLKLDASRPEIEKLGRQWPASYTIGAAGWAKLIVGDDHTLALEKYIAESYALVATAKSKAKPAATKATKKRKR